MWGGAGWGSVIARRVSDGGKPPAFPWSGGAALGTRSGRWREVFEEPVKEVSRRDAVEAAGRGAAILARDGVVVQDRQGLQLPQAEVMQGVVAQRELTIAPLHAGAAPLEEIRALLGSAFQFGLKRRAERPPKAVRRTGPRQHLGRQGPQALPL